MEKHHRDQFLAAAACGEELSIESIRTGAGVEHRASLSGRCIGVTDTAVSIATRDAAVVTIALSAVIRVSSLPPIAHDVGEAR